MTVLNRASVSVLALVSLCVGISTATYRAAVVEFYPDQQNLTSSSTGFEPIENNLKGFKNVLDAVYSTGGVNIIIFPECAILGYNFTSREEIVPYLEEIPEITGSQEMITPCSDATFKDRPILQNLSCLAREYKVVLVANMGDIQPCNHEPCPNDKKYHFNTNVVFETDGTLVAKYHKINLYAGEAIYFNPGSYSNNTCVAFDTSFGVKFGTFTCYDILFKEPADCLLSKNITNFVLPTAWGNSYPFYMSIAVQQAWSQKHGVNFLAANLHFNANLHTGSGIYSNGVATHYVISSDSWAIASGKVIVVDLSENPNATLANVKQVEVARLYEISSDLWEIVSDQAMVADQSENPNATLLNVRQLGKRSNTQQIKSKNNTNMNFTLITSQDGLIEVEYHNKIMDLDLNCRLEYSKKSTLAEEQYALGAFIGSSVRNRQFKYAVCTLVKCTPAGKCGEPVDGYQANTTFSQVSLSGTFADGSDVYGTALGSGLELLNPSFMKLEAKSMTISGYDQPLLSANLWTRVYDN